MNIYMSEYEYLYYNKYFIDVLTLYYLILGMHGAGIPQIFHAAIGEPNCCSVIELFPESNQGFSNIYGFGNIAKLLGMCGYMQGSVMCIYRYLHTLILTCYNHCIYI